MKIFITFVLLGLFGKSYGQSNQTSEWIDLDFTGKDFYCLATPNENVSLVFKNEQISLHTGHDHDFLSSSFGSIEMCSEAFLELTTEIRGRKKIKLIKENTVTYRTERYRYRSTCIRRGGLAAGDEYPCEREGTREVSLEEERVSIELNGYRFTHVWKEK